MTKIGCFLAALASATIGLAAAWYIQRSVSGKQEETSAPVFTSTDVDTGLSGQLANMIVGGKFPSDQPDLTAPRKTVQERAIELAKERVQNNLAEARAEARQLLGTVKAPSPYVFFLGLNDCMEQDEILDLVPEDMQEEILQQNKEFFQKMAACAGMNNW
ncbi:uncharacterized protein LOC110977106 [Acanthaster planci]|uniref:Uncharacterized protein LOC110977106 n=1 Tax=Acanthaster planci TaxID=133434 RepID=A0A8B7Y427_ACAPL|nr:uncharacterized protein LOC110977106 [Acanthaster planci]